MTPEDLCGFAGGLLRGMVYGSAIGGVLAILLIILEEWKARRGR